MTTHLTESQLVDYAHGMLPAQEDARVLSHLHTCAQCAAALDAEMRIVEALRDHVRKTDVEMPPAVKAAIWARVREAQPSPFARFRTFLRPVIALPAAAALAAGIYFGTTQLTARPTPAIDASYYLQDAAAVDATMPLGSKVSATANAAE